jgi:hypothetical protein
VGEPQKGMECCVPGVRGADGRPDEPYYTVHPNLLPAIEPNYQSRPQLQPSLRHIHSTVYIASIETIVICK